MSEQKLSAPNVVWLWGSVGKEGCKGQLPISIVIAIDPAIGVLRLPGEEIDPLECLLRGYSHLDYSFDHKRGLNGGILLKGSREGHSAVLLFLNLSLNGLRQ